MNAYTNQSSPNASVLEEAADWVDRFDSLCEAEHRAFTEWLEIEQNKRAFERVSRIMGQPEIVAKGQALLAEHRAASRLAQTPTSLQCKANVSRFPHLSTWLYASAASLLVAAIFITTNVWQPSESSSPGDGIVNQVPVNQWQQEDVTTQIGELRSTVLNDGSIVYLGADTAFVVSHTADKRAVRLQQGQAYFDVAHAPHRPFEVEAGDVVITVVGTAFDVERLGSKTDIQVYDGTVNVAADKRLTLYKGDGVVLENGRVIQETHVNNRQLPTWRTGWLEAESKPIKDIVATLNRYLKKPISYTGDEHYAVSGRFPLNNPKRALKLLASIDELQLQERQTSYTLTLTD